ncbi:unnamed protein product [Amoebophrya sp. A120]|nr:unnamed protein product [Amoebophrya sp. A120]|eukprot:GSA120T00010797001.1
MTKPGPFHRPLTASDSRVALAPVAKEGSGAIPGIPFKQDGQACVACYTQDRNAELANFLDKDKFFKVNSGDQDPANPLVHSQFGELTRRPSIDTSLQAIFERRVVPFQRVHLAGAKCEDWLRESEETRRQLFHVGWIFNVVDDWNWAALQSLAVSFFAQAAPAIMCRQETLCLPWRCSSLRPYLSPTRGSNTYELDSWLYLFWDDGLPVVTILLYPAFSCAGGSSHCNSFLFTDAAVPRLNVLNPAEGMNSSALTWPGKKMEMAITNPDGSCFQPRYTAAPATDDDATKVVRGFWVSQKLHTPSLAQIDTRPFIALEIVDFAKYVDEGRVHVERSRSMEEWNTYRAAENLPQMSYEDAAREVGIALVGNLRGDGLRGHFLDRPNSAAEIEFFGMRHTTGLLVGKPPSTFPSDIHRRWNLRRMHWLEQLGRRKKRALFGAVFSGSDSSSYDENTAAHAAAPDTWMALGDFTPHDQQIIDAIDSYLSENDLLGVSEKGRRCITGRVPFAPAAPEDAIDRYLVEEFWSDTQDGTNCSDLSAEQIAQAALIGLDDPKALLAVLENDKSGCLLGPDSEKLQADVAALLREGEPASLRVDDENLELDLDYGQEQPQARKEKVKTRGRAGAFKVNSARERAEHFRKTWEAEHELSADEAFRRSCRGAGLDIDDLDEPPKSSVSSTRSMPAANAKRRGKKSGGSASIRDECLPRKGKAVWDIVAQKRVTTRQTKRGLHLLSKSGLLTVENVESESGMAAKTQLKLNVRGSHHVLHGPGGTATIVRDHKGSTGLSGKQFGKTVERVIAITRAGG